MANYETFFASAAPKVLGIFRIVVGFLFTAHGTQKIFNFPAAAQPGELSTLMAVGGTLELIGGVMIMFGLYTRAMSFVMSGMMAVAYFMFHAPAGFLPLGNGGELAVLYSFAFLYLTAAGPGAFSLDGLFRRSAVPEQMPGFAVGSKI